MSEYVDAIRRAADCLRDRTGGFRPEIGVALGSGWGAFSDRVKNAVCVPFADVPGMPASTVVGHSGEWVFGELAGRKVAVMSGRYHGYEGHAAKKIALPVRVLRELGAGAVILTNAAGGVNLGYRAGDLMAISDHIAFASGMNPLFGPNDDELGPRFPDMSVAYDKELRVLAAVCAKELGVTLREGVYALMAGPSFETPAEIRMLRALGADAVGMSTVPEVIAARHGGMRVLAFSLITNMAAGVLDQPLTHAEVMAAGKEAIPRVSALLERILSRMPVADS